MVHRRPLLLALLASLAAAPAASATPILDTTTVRASASSARSCLVPRTAGDAVVRRTVLTDGNGLVRARLLGRRGDWDVAIFDATTRKLVAGSTHFGSRELAEGVAPGGTKLIVQACRRRGGAGEARLSVQNVVSFTGKAAPVQLVRVYTPTRPDKDLLVALDLDLTEHGRAGYLDVLLYDEKDLRKLVTSGLRFEVLIADLAAADKAQMKLKLAPPDGMMPSGRVQYRRLPEFADDLKKLAADNPALVKPITLPFTSLEGRPVEGVEISDNVTAKDGKPVFAMFGVHHAREWPSAEMTIEFAFELINRFTAGDERAVGLLKKSRVIVVPIINPDGFNLSRESVVDTYASLADVSFAYKRKNCRVQDLMIPAEGACGMSANRRSGTDPNRNYGGFWGGPGSGATAMSETYRGAGPFSEPETQNVRALVSSRQATVMVTNHTYSDLVLRPPGLASQGVTPDESAMKALGEAMSAENGYVSQPSYELYDTSGTTEDWSYFATGGYGYTFEIGAGEAAATGFAVTGSGFHPPYPIGVMAEWFGKTPTGGGNREAYFKALETAADPKHHATLKGTGPSGATIRLHKEFDTITRRGAGEDSGPSKFRDVLDTTMEIPAGGAFELHANQSTRPIVVSQGVTEMWTLTCESGGTILGRSEVLVSRGETKDLGAVCKDESGASPPAAGALALTVEPGRTNLRGLVRKGLVARVACSGPCKLGARLFQGKRLVGRASSKRVTSTVKLRVKLSKSGVKRLRRAKRATLKLQVIATGDGGERVARTKTLKLKR